MNVRVLRTIHDFDPAAWDALCDDLVFSHAWFRALEESRAVDAAPRHLILEEAGRVIGILPCFIQHGDLHYTLADRLFGPLAPALSRLGLRVLPALLAYSPLAHRTELFLAAGTDRTAAIRACTEAMDRICRDEGLPVSGWLFAPGEDRALAAALTSAGHAEIFLAPTASWMNRYDTFEGYLDSLKQVSQHRARVVRNELNRARRSGASFEAQPISSIDDRTLAAMHAAHHRRYHAAGGAARPLPEAFFRALARHLNGQAAVHTARRDGALLGYSIVLKGRDRWHIFLNGELDEARAHADKQHFQVTYYVPMRLAIESRVKRLDYGLSAYEAKTLRGCTLQPLHGFVRPHARRLRVWLPWYLRFVDWRYQFKHRAVMAAGRRRRADLPERARPQWTPHDPVWRQAWRMWRGRGASALLRAAVQRAARLVWEQTTLVEWRLPLDPAKPVRRPAIPVQADIRRLGAEELARLRPVTSSAMYRLFERFAQQGGVCYTASVDGAVVAYNWYTDRPYRSPLTQITFPVESGERFVIYSHTVRAWRGRGVDAVLKAVAFRDFQQQGVRAIRTAVEADNRPSHRIALKLGASPCRQYHYRRCLWWRRTRVEPLASAGPEVLLRLAGRVARRTPSATPDTQEVLLDGIR